MQKIYCLNVLLNEILLAFCHLFQIIDGGILGIKNMTFADAGDYECIIKSAVGRIASKTSVFVYGPPGPPGKQ